jgi:hypothetical protein
MAPKKANGSKSPVTKNLPAVKEPITLYPLATLEDLEPYSFMDASSLEAVRENIGGQILTPADFTRIKFPSAGSQFWELPNLEGDLEPVKAIQGIVLMRRDTRVYWTKEYDGERIPPDCSSDDCITGKGTPGGLCATCPNSQWESDPKGGGGQACKAVGIQFVMVAGDALPIIIPVPPTSLQPVKKFMLGLSSKKLRYYDCILSFNLEQAQNKGGIKYSRIKLKLVSVLPELAREQIQAYKTSFSAAFAKVKVADVAAQSDVDGTVTH